MEISSQLPLPELSQIMPILNPQYPPQYREKFHQLKSLIKNKIFTKRTNQLAEWLIPYGEGNYNCWFAKKMCFKEGNISLQNELSFVEKTLRNKVKNFQMWEHRKFLMQYHKEYEKQLKFTSQMLQLELKNYHVWSYRSWLLNHIIEYNTQWQYTSTMIARDSFNNSVWSYRYNVLKHILNKNQCFQEIIQKQLNFVLEEIKKQIHNESAWNYLRGIFPSIKLKTIPNTNSQNPTICKSYSQYPFIIQFCQQNISKIQEQKKIHQKTIFNINSQNQKQMLIKGQIQCMITLIHIYSLESDCFKYIKDICSVLSILEPQKSNYWKWIQKQFD